MLYFQLQREFLVCLTEAREVVTSHRVKDGWLASFNSEG